VTTDPTCYDSVLKCSLKWRSRSPDDTSSLILLCKHILSRFRLAVEDATQWHRTTPSFTRGQSMIWARHYDPPSAKIGILFLNFHLMPTNPIFSYLNSRDTPLDHTLSHFNFHDTPLNLILNHLNCQDSPLDPSLNHFNFSRSATETYLETSESSRLATRSHSEPFDFFNTRQWILVPSH
jgi:hypothetical protein